MAEVKAEVISISIGKYGQNVFKQTSYINNLLFHALQLCFGGEGMCQRRHVNLRNGLSNRLYHLRLTGLGSMALMVEVGLRPCLRCCHGSLAGLQPVSSLTQPVIGLKRLKSPLQDQGDRTSSGLTKVTTRSLTIASGPPP